MSEEHRENGQSRDTIERALIDYYTATTREPSDVALNMWQLVAPWLAFARDGSHRTPADARNDIAVSDESHSLPAPAHLRFRAILARGGVVAITLILVALLVIVVVAMLRH
jgi:hypothetical protein